MEEKYIKDLEEIKDIMNRSTRFISLSGLSGVSTGIIALIGAFAAYHTVFKKQGYLVYDAVNIDAVNVKHLLLIAVGTLVASIVTAIFFTSIKTKMQKQTVWDVQTKRLLLHLLIPLVTGGVLCLMLLMKGFVGITLPLMLIFYGLALVNGSKYTLDEIRTLGLIEIILGLVAFQFIDYSLHLWALGFGVVQIAYGIIIQLKYKL